MQFKYPELLWALFLLLIPIIIHLFQLRRFKKTPFTNVKVLKRVQSESRRSNTLKKWLLLVTRLLLLAALVIAFAQPFFAEKTAMAQKETVIYLDDSFSMQAKQDNTSLLENAVQDIIKSVPAAERLTLFTNDKVFRNVTLPDIQNELLVLDPTRKQLRLNEILLKAATFFDADAVSLNNLILISDFQERMRASPLDSTGEIQKYWVKLTAPSLENTAIDSVFLKDSGQQNIELTALVSSNADIESIPVSLYDGDKLIAKTSAVFTKNKTAQVNFTLPADQKILGKLELMDSGLSYDNRLYFNIDGREKIKVLAIGSVDNSFLERIFDADEFDFRATVLQNLNYGALDQQQLIILNELKTLPTPLATSLKTFREEGGSLVVIPSEALELASYNSFLANTMSSTLSEVVATERDITNISFAHPLYKEVFEREISNFQYPKVSQYYRITTKLPTALSFQDGEPFLVGDSGRYVFAAALNAANSNFKNSPLIVPTLYNMGIYSLKMPDLYELIGIEATVDVPIQLEKDHILKVSNPAYDFIPSQRSYANKVALTFPENGIRDGIYGIMDNDSLLRHISFNYPHDESVLRFIDQSEFGADLLQNSVASLFEEMQKNNAITALWKWFVILALLMLLVEIVIQKYLP